MKNMYANQVLLHIRYLAKRLLLFMKLNEKFYYKYIKTKCNNSVKFLFTDTDGLVY